MTKRNPMKYETMFIVKPTLTEEELKAKVDLIKSAIEKQGASVDAVWEMGSRQLAYKIKKFERGFYVVIYFTAEGSAIRELERIYRINEDIIRFIIIKYAKQVEVAAWENMVKKAKGEPYKEMAFIERERKPKKTFDPEKTKEETPKFQEEEDVK